MAEIEKVSNGYILRTPALTEVYERLDDVFAILLMYFEGRSKHFGGDSFGVVRIDRGQGYAETRCEAEPPRG